MGHTMNKSIFFDVDNTLVCREENTICESTIRAIEKLKNNIINKQLILKKNKINNTTQKNSSESFHFDHFLRKFLIADSYFGLSPI